MIAKLIPVKSQNSLFTTICWAKPCEGERCSSSGRDETSSGRDLRRSRTRPAASGAGGSNLGVGPEGTGASGGLGGRRDPVCRSSSGRTRAATSRKIRRRLFEVRPGGKVIKHFAVVDFAVFKFRTQSFVLNSLQSIISRALLWQGQKICFFGNTTLISKKVVFLAGLIN